MNRLKVLVTVTDGVDNDDDGQSFYIRLITQLKQGGVFSLSCGIGSVGVEHDGLDSIARLSGGQHLAVEDGQSIASALASVTRLIHTRVGEIGRIVIDEAKVEIERLGFVSSHTSRIPIDLLILIDQSWSMLGMVQYEDEQDEWSGDRSKLPNTKEAAIRIIQSLDPSCDLVGVASFCDRYTLRQRLTTDLDSCVDAINSIDGGYGTFLYRSMYLATQDLAQ